MGNTFSYRLLYKVQKSKTRNKNFYLYINSENIGQLPPPSFFLWPIKSTFFPPSLQDSYGILQQSPKRKFISLGIAKQKNFREQSDAVTVNERRLCNCATPSQNSVPLRFHRYIHSKQHYSLIDTTICILFAGRQYEKKRKI